MVSTTFEDLKAWQEAHKLVIQIYTVTKRFPQEEKFRLVDQLCRVVSSAAADLVEGRSRQSKKEYLQFVYQAKGSLEETKYHLLLAKDLGYIDNTQYSPLLEQENLTGKLINGLISYLNSQVYEKIPKNQERRTRN